VSSDPTLDRFRADLANEDRAILEAVNTRMRLVAELKRYKEEAGLPFLDAEQERRLLDRLAGENPGPLSEAGVRELFESILGLMKRELADGTAEAGG
jgi:chorismate mutase